jgi:hypothetical protein
MEVAVESGESDVEIHPSLHDIPEVDVDGEESSVIDPAKAAHDTAAVMDVQLQAISFMADPARGVKMTEVQKTTALGLFPKVNCD